MGLLNNLCAPALIYLTFSLTQIIIDMFKNEINKAFFKFIVMIIFTLLLNLLCLRGLGIVSWLLVFVPFMLMSFVTVILLFMFGLDPTTGKLRAVPSSTTQTHHHRHKKRKHNEKYKTNKY